MFVIVRLFRIQGAHGAREWLKHGEQKNAGLTMHWRKVIGKHTKVQIHALRKEHLQDAAYNIGHGVNP